MDCDSNNLRKIETDEKGLNSSNDGLIPFSSLSCYEEMCRLAEKERPNYALFRRPPLFFREVYDMVDDPSTDSVVSWSESSTSFIVWNEYEFLTDVLPSCLPFDYKDMTSLTTWFHVIGYNKVEESEHWEYTANYLVRGQPPHPEDTTTPCIPGGIMITPEFAKIIEKPFASRNARKQ